MLVQLTPSQIAQAWPSLREPIRKALIPQMDVSAEALNNILRNLEQGTSQAWLLTDIVEGRSVVYAVGTT